MTEQNYDVIIVGAGFGGIGAAIQLKRLGIENFVILDRLDDLDLDALADNGVILSTDHFRSPWSR